MEILLTNGKLRPWVEADAPAIAKHANNRKIAENMRDGFPYPYTIQDAYNWLNMTVNTNHIMLAIEVQGEAAGGIGVMFQDNVYRLSAELGYWIGEQHWRKGITSEAIRKLSAYVFENTGVVRIYADIFSPNIPSMRTIEKAGFHLEGIHKKAVYKNGKLLDEHVYAKLKENS